MRATPFIFLFAFSLALISPFVSTAYAVEIPKQEEQQGGIRKEILDRLTTAGGEAKYDTQQGLAKVVGGVIQTILSIVGMIFFVMMAFGGLKWLTSQGDEKKIGEATHLIVNSIYGLVITMSAYAITVFVTNAIQRITLISPGP